jgi:drug/metabolite transporter (DMT)-like permease
LGVILAASLLLGERVAPVAWLGIACTALGILLVAAAIRP